MKTEKQIKKRREKLIKMRGQYFNSSLPEQFIALEIYVLDWVLKS